MNEILLHKFDTAFQSFPFDKISIEDYEPTILHLLDDAQKEIEAIAQQEAAPSFENTIVKMETNGRALNRVVEAFFNLHSANTNDNLEAAAQNLAPALAAFSNNILLNEALFKRVKTIYEQQAQNQLNAEQQRLLDKTYKSFSRNGALLNPSDKEKLRAIDQKIAVLKLQFSQNVLQETNAYKLHLTSDTDIEGLPDSLLQQAAMEAKQAEIEGYIFTLQFPSYVPFMKYASNRKRRIEMYEAYGRRCFQANDNNNENVIKELVALKHERAQLLGYTHHAAFVLEERMAKSVEKVDTFLNDLLGKAKPYAIKEIENLASFAQQMGNDTLMPYDHAYFAEKLREEKFNYAEEQLKAYFPLHQTLEAAFGLAKKLFNLEFEKLENIATYHEEVTVYNVTENGSHKALLYADFHPREGKRPGAWMTSFKGQYIDEDGNNSRPHVSIVCNFTRPSSDTPSLLTFTEVTTLFHELGHALHGIIANTTYESLSGTNVYWDFVELPSQFLENYCYEKEFLQQFAKHWKTQETLDDATIDKIVAAANFMEGYQTMRQLSFGLLDMAYHSGKMKADETIQDFERKEVEPTRLYPLIDGVAFSPSFSHIFGGGYDAGYYSYKWAEVLDADAFDFFKQTGIFNSQTAAKYKQLLSAGGTIDPETLYLNFRGRTATVDALLTRAGLQ